MPPKSKKAASAPAAEPAHGYEFGGPLGATAISFGLPILVYTFTFVCNDISGCPAPSLLSPKTLDINQLKVEVGWPEEGLWGLASWSVTLNVLAYYFVNLLLYRLLPATEMEGTVLASGGRLKYRFNTFYSNMTLLAVALAGTITSGAHWPVWTYISDNYIQIITANMMISYGLATFVYVRSFSVKPGNKENRELAPGGHTGNMIYDWYIGRELNPRAVIPFIGEIDIKEWCELRPGMLGWALLNFAWVAKQYRTYGSVTDSIVFISAVQLIYIMDGWFMEPAILTTIDVTSDGFGFMLAFGDLSWLPFVYTLQTRYLSVHPVSLGPVGCVAMLAILGSGFYTFRAANSQKNAFRTNPDDPSVAHLEYIETRTGSKLLVTGWWGIARHINYLGDWIQAWPYSLPTGLAGYTILAAGTGAEGAYTMADGREVIQGAAKGWGMLVTYFYVVYFAILLIHRDRRDDEKCHRKYGDDWLEYKKRVKYRILPYVY